MTARLSDLLLRHWETLDGFAVGHGLNDLRLMPLDRMSHFVWWYFTRNANEQQTEKFKAQLWRPPAVGDPIPERSPWSAENEMKSFNAVKAMVSPKG